MANLDELKRLVNEMPDPDGGGRYTQNIDKQRIDEAVAEIARGGKENLLALISLLDAPGTAQDVKPHYALHCVVNFALASGNENMRREFCEAMASQLENPQLSLYNRAYLCQELQWAGAGEACAALGKVLADENLTDAAATALAGIGGPHAAAPLRAAAAANAQGKCRLNVLDALASLDDPESANVFKQALADGDREVRIAAAVGLARLGRADTADLLLKTADAAEGWERTQATKACLVLAEKLAAAGNKDAARQVYRRLQQTRTAAGEAHIRQAAERGLAMIA